MLTLRFIASRSKLAVIAPGRIETIRRHLQTSKIKLQATSGLATSQIGTSQFRYTLDNPLLSNQQRAFYEENGYLVLPKLVEDSLLDECETRFIDLCEGRQDKKNMTLMKDLSLMKKGAKGQYLYYKVQSFTKDEILSKYSSYAKILDYVECFTGPNIMSIHTMLINKPPDSGALTSRHPLHQDLHYFPIRPADLIVASWTAMDECTVDNGCLFVLPGSHRNEQLYQHDYPRWEGGVNAMFHGIQGFDEVPKKMLPMKRGDTVLFHPLLIHGSGANNTNDFRKSISSHYASSNCNYIEVKGTSQENIAIEIEAMMKKRGFEGFTFVDYWNYISKLERGDRINL